MAYSCRSTFQKGGTMHTVNKRQLELLRERYPQGTTVCLDAMVGERQMESGMKGKVSFVDDMGQIHVKWENGSGLALIPGVDQFHKASEPAKKKHREELSR